MATSITQKPNLLSAVNTPMIYILKESASGTYDGYKFRYVLKVEVDGVEKAVIKIHKNQSNVGVFDISHLLKTYVETQLINQNNTAYSIHSLGIVETGKPFSQNRGQCAKVEVKAYTEVAASATTAPVLSAQQANAISYYTPATTPFIKTETNVGGLDINGTNFPLSEFMNSTSAADRHTFFTNSPTVQFVRGATTAVDNIDQLTICFKQGDNSSTPASLITDGEKLEQMAIQYYNSAGTLISATSGTGTVHFFANSNANGGATAAESNTVGEAILYFGCGTKNLETQNEQTNARPSNFADWAYYRIFGCTSADVDDRCTKYYYFYRYGSGAKVDDRHQTCTRYDNIRLAWRNRLGAWDYMNFRGKSIKTLSIESSEMESVPGNWDDATENTFNYNNWDRGKKTLFKNATRKITINSDWLNEDESVWLEELFTSTNVQILNDDYTIIDAVVITDNAYTTKTSLNDGIKMQYTINLEYANKVRTNS